LILGANDGLHQNCRISSPNSMVTQMILFLLHQPSTTITSDTTLVEAMIAIFNDG